MIERPQLSFSDTSILTQVGQDFHNRIILHNVFFSFLSTNSAMHLYGNVFNNPEGSGNNFFMM